MIEAVRLSKNFLLSELTHTDYKVDNTPNAVQLLALGALAGMILQPVRDHFKLPVKVNSGFRSVAVNAAAGRTGSSQHSKGEAADIEIPGIENAKLFAWIEENLPFDQLIAEKLSVKDPTAGWIHVSYSKKATRKETLSFNGERYVHGFYFLENFPHV